MPSTLEIILYIIIGLGGTFYIISSIYQIKTGKKLFGKKKKKEDPNDDD